MHCADFRLVPYNPAGGRGKDLVQRSRQVFFRAKKILVHVAKTPSLITKTSFPAAEQFFSAARNFCHVIKNPLGPAGIFCDAANKIFLRARIFFHASQTFFDTARSFFHIKKSPENPVSSLFKRPQKTAQTQHRRGFCELLTPLGQTS